MIDLTTINDTPIWLTLKLAACTTSILLLIATPLSWWLTQHHGKGKTFISTLIAMPLVLPPTVLGFYLLILMGPNGVVGEFTQWIGVGTLPFSFAGLVIASVIYSMPFAVIPISNAFEQLGKRPMEVAATLGASPFNRFFTIAVPMAKTGLLSAAVLSFAHTVGEFGVVLMLGGNIEGETRVLSVAIYDHVESLEYGQAHILSAGLIAFSFVILLFLNRMSNQQKWRSL